jgi:hypothetical protein
MAKITIETEDGRVLKFSAYTWDLEMRANHYPINSLDIASLAYVPGPTTGSLRFEILPGTQTEEKAPEEVGAEIMERYLKLIGALEEE